VQQVVVELMGAMPLFGQDISHGSHPIGTDSSGSGSATAGTPPPRMHVKTNVAHAAQCTWLDQCPQSNDNLPGCAGCQDEGAIEPYINCSYTSLGVLVSAAKTFESYRVLELLHDTDDFQRQSLGRQRTTEILAPHTLENLMTFYASGNANFTKVVDQLAAMGFTKVVDQLAAMGFTEVVDQLAAMGFEMIVFGFGGSCLVDINATHMAELKAQMDKRPQQGGEGGWI
jgi:hypothetical protein